MGMGTSGAPDGAAMLWFSTVTRSFLGHSPEAAASISAIHLRAATGSLGTLLKKGFIWTKPARNSGSMDASYCSMFMEYLFVDKLRHRKWKYPQRGGRAIRGTDNAFWDTV